LSPLGAISLTAVTFHFMLRLHYAFPLVCSFPSCFLFPLSSSLRECYPSQCRYIAFCSHMNRQHYRIKGNVEVHWFGMVHSIVHVSHYQRQSRLCKHRGFCVAWVFRFFQTFICTPDFSSCLFFVRTLLIYLLNTIFLPRSQESKQPKWKHGPLPFCNVTQHKVYSNMSKTRFESSTSPIIQTNKVVEQNLWKNLQNWTYVSFLLSPYSTKFFSSALVFTKFWCT